MRVNIQGGYLLDQDMRVNVPGGYALDAPGTQVEWEMRESRAEQSRETAGVGCFTL